MALYKEHFQKYNTVIGCNSSGCYVRDAESDKVVFFFGNGAKGDKVQLTIKKVDAKRERVTCASD